MRFDIVTLFPGYFASPLSESLVGRAVEAGILEVHLVDLRDFSEDPHRKVDDEPYGGGPGMVLTAPPVFAAVEALRSEEGAPPHVAFLSPQGRRFDTRCARELAARPRVALVCGRYEGIDERTRVAGLFDEEISLGDFVLSGGEAAALAILEAAPQALARARAEAQARTEGLEQPCRRQRRPDLGGRSDDCSVVHAAPARPCYCWIAASSARYRSRCGSGSAWGFTSIRIRW